MYVLHVLICGDNGISHPLDVCFGDQLASSLVNLHIGVGTRFHLDSTVETLGTLLSTSCWLNR